MPEWRLKRRPKRRLKGRRGKRGGQGGLHAPLALAFLCLLASLGALAWREIGGPLGGQPPGTERWRIALYDVEAGKLRDLPLEEYLIGVVAAEMPASFHEQALRAQAVAARTRAVAGLRRLDGRGCALYAGADICSDSAHCQAWADDAALRARWGGDYAKHLRKISGAVRDTRGQVMTYGGKPIEVLYHAVSGGATEDVEHVFAQALPYLRGVDSPGEENATRYRNVQRFSLAEAAAALNAAFPEAGVTAAGLPGALAVLERFDSGRVAQVRVGGAVVTGVNFRRALGLYSANFTLAFEGNELVTDQRGYGHGVGMSQTGADAMARAGSGYADILRHYYSGVLIEQW